MRPTPAHPIERAVGMEFYLTDSPGTGGEFRRCPEDFKVVEIVDLRTADRGRYAYYECEKQGIDTLAAVELLARLLGVKRSSIGYAGLKDARAYTVQYFSVKTTRQLPEVLESRSARFKLIGYGSTPLKPGGLEGNTFSIVVRDASPGYREYIERCLTQIDEMGGLYNFFGHQRFGTRRPNTHRVGMYIVKRMWKEAVLEIVGRPSLHERPELAEARRIFEETLDPELALELFPKRMVYERIILRSLSKAPEDPLRALRSLPKAVLRLYVDAYQSYLFNRVLSRRVSYGIEPSEYVEGDLILCGDLYRRASVRGRLNPRESLMLPLPGYGIRLPAGESGRIYAEVLREENVGLEEFMVKELGVCVGKGGLREAIMRIEGLSWRPLTDTSYQVDFRLKRGMYATVFLREIVKGDPLRY